MEILRDLLLIFLAFICGISLGQISGMTMATKNFGKLLKGFIDDEEKESKEN